MRCIACVGAVVLSMSTGLMAEEAGGLKALRSGSLGVTSPAPRMVDPPGYYALSIDGAFNLGGFVFKNGVPLLHTNRGYQDGNTALGLNALVSTTPDQPYSGYGVANTAVGQGTLRSNTEGYFNTGVGFKALHMTDEGDSNVAVGGYALYSTTNGDSNTAVGTSALISNTIGDGSTAVGESALSYAIGGRFNTAVGKSALYKQGDGIGNVAVGAFAAGDTTGSYNIALGTSSGRDVEAGNFTIMIGNRGDDADSNLIRIGEPFDDMGDGDATNDEGHNQVFLHGIGGAVSGSAVYVHTAPGDQLGQLGTSLLSSHRFKQQVEELSESSQGLRGLRPVKFRYRGQPGAGASPVEFGLIAEEVAEVLPEIVVYDGVGRPLSVRYRQLTPLLVSEFQKQRRELVFHRWALGMMLLAGVVVSVGRWRAG